MTRGSARAALAAILVLAALLRIVSFIGLVSGDPQDDGIYYNTAYSLYREGRSQLQIFRTVPPDWIPNPIDQFHVRPMITYPIAATFAVFGPGEVAAAMWALLCSLITIVVVYRLGCVLYDRAVGLVASFLCAIYPLEVINATRILSDVQIGMFFAVGLLLVVEGERRERPGLYALAGMAVGGAYLANPRGLIVLLALVAFAAAQWFTARPRAMWQAPLLVLAGFGVVFAIEAIIYYVQTGDPLLNYHVHSGAARFKYLHEPVTRVGWGWLQVSYTNGVPLDLLRSVLGMTNRANQFGLFFVLFVAALVFAIITRRSLLLVALTIGFFFYLEFGPVQVSIDWAARTVDYMMVFKQDRFLLMLTAPLVVLSGALLRSLARKSWIGALVVIVLLASSSAEAVKDSRDFYRAGLHDLRTLAAEIRANPDRTYAGDYWAVEHVAIFTRHTAKNLRVVGPATTADQLKGACVILGGSRGVELVADYFESTIPPFARDVLATGIAPENWTLVRHVTGPRNTQRRHDLRVYCVR